MSELKLTKTTIRDLATPQSFSRGEDYYNSGAVWSVERHGNILLAEVEGSGYDPYQVSVELDAGGVTSADCSCPYDWGGCCKHIVAALLAFIHEPEMITERPSVTDLLADLSREALVDLLTGLLETHPRLSNWVEARVAVVKQAELTTQPEGQAGPRQRRTTLDPATFRRQAHSIMQGLSHMRPSEAYWHTSGMVEQIREVIQQAQPFLKAGDGRNALVILEAVTDVYVDRWIEFDDSDGYLGDLFEDLGSALSEAILSADLSAQERDDWAQKLTAWQGEVEAYGIDGGFDVAIATAVQGWDYPPLQRAMQGQITELGAWEDEAPWYADELAVARLNVLERQGQVEAYLNLAQAEGQTAHYVTMLVKVGRGKQAVADGLKILTTTDDALALAQALREHNLHQEALQIAEHGLTLHGETYGLACWLRDLAGNLGKHELALRVAHIAFVQRTTLDEYEAVQDVAGTAWPQIKRKLLEHLAIQDYGSGRIDIYLHEGMVDEAVKAVDKSGYLGYDTLERVVDAAYHSHPDWAIRQCKAQAERIMDADKSKYYHHAVRWLGKARQAYEAADRIDEWCSYLQSVIDKHYRKYSLRPQLEGLRE